MFGREAVFAGSLEFPAKLAGLCIECIEIAVIAGEENRAAGDRRGGSDAAAGFEFPILLSGGGIDGIEEVVCAAEENRVANNRRGRENFTLRCEFPFELGEPGERGSLVDAGMFGAAAKGRRVSGKSDQRKQTHDGGHQK